MGGGEITMAVQSGGGGGRASRYSWEGVIIESLFGV